MVQYYQKNKNQKISTIDTNSLQHLCTIEDPKQKGKQSKKQKQSTPLRTEWLVDILASVFAEKPNTSNDPMGELLKVSC